MPTGYTHSRYAQSLVEFGNPHELPRCGGWILERRIPEFPDRDAMGCYPFFACQDWSQLYYDLEDVGNELVSLALVTDPFGEYELTYLRRCFKDIVFPFKQHFIVDLSRPINTYVSNHHRRNTHKAHRNVQVERCCNPVQFIAEWVSLYDVLIKRHNIRGIPAFSILTFIEQLKVPGIIMFRATHNEATVGMVLWFANKDVGYFHLASYNATGYRLYASFALFWYAIEYFADQGLRWLNLGAGAGVESNGTDGLSRFKRGWSTETRTAYFCGRIFNPVRYSEIVKTKESIATNYFPAYRWHEFR